MSVVKAGDILQCKDHRTGWYIATGNSCVLKEKTLLEVYRLEGHVSNLTRDPIRTFIIEDGTFYRRNGLDYLMPALPGQEIVKRAGDLKDWSFDDMAFCVFCRYGYYGPDLQKMKPGQLIHKLNEAAAALNTQFSNLHV